MVAVILVGQRRTELDRATVDIDRVRREEAGFPVTHSLLAQITTAVSLGSYRWRYSWVEAQMNGNAPGARPNGLTGEAFSVSEMSNAAFYSYGVVPANLPAGFVPVRIPATAYVLIFPHRRTNGTLTWLIANTQAIDGNC